MISNETQSLVQVAIMYYKEHLNQQEIADKLNITRQTVMKMLKKAEDEGIVEFHINNPLNNLSDLADRLCEKYSLQHAVVVPCRFSEQDLVTSVLAQYAGNYIDELLSSGCVNVGISWGRSVYSTIANLQPGYHEDVTFFPLLGASNKTAEYFMVNEMVRKAAAAFNATPFYTYIPADPGSEHDYDLFRHTSAYESINEYWKKLDLAIMGIGVAPLSEKGFRSSYPGEQYISHAQYENAVGDILTHYFDNDGKFISNDGAKILCASIEDLHNAGKVLAIAGGLNKAKAISAALKTGIVTDIIIDQKTCEKVLKLGN